MRLCKESAAQLHRQDWFAPSPRCHPGRKDEPLRGEKPDQSDPQSAAFGLIIRCQERSDISPVLDQILRRHGTAPIKALALVRAKQLRFFEMEGSLNTFNHCLGTAHMTEVDD